MSDLLSKVSASGLSAGVFLLWWPAHVASQGSDALLVRGVLWALVFEILLLGFRPLERAIGRAVRTREAGAVAPRRLAPLLALAAVAAAVPVTMLCGSRAPLGAPARAAAAKVIVKREIVRREVVVRRVSHVVRVPAPGVATPTPAAAASAPASARATMTTTAAKPAATATTKTPTTGSQVVTTGATADSKADLPGSTVTTTKPAATTPAPSAAPAPATPAATPASASAR